MANRSTTRIADLTVDVYEPAGPPKSVLVFSHGAWVGGWIWETFADWFAGHGYLCYCPTWRGRYDSKPVADLGAVSIYDFVEDALDVARSAKPDFVIGESLGGLIAMKAAESLPGLKGLILMNPAPPFMVPVKLAVLRKQFKYMGDLLGKKPNLPDEEDYKELILNNVAEPEASEFYKKICPDSGRALMEASLGRIKVDPGKLTMPVRVVVGHLDALLPPKVHHRVAGMLGAELDEYPAMSHHTFSESGWEQVAKSTEQWIASKVNGS